MRRTWNVTVLNTLDVRGIITAERAPACLSCVDFSVNVSEAPEFEPTESLVSPNATEGGVEDNATDGGGGGGVHIRAPTAAPEISSSAAAPSAAPVSLAALVVVEVDLPREALELVPSPLVWGRFRLRACVFGEPAAAAAGAHFARVGPGGAAAGAPVLPVVASAALGGSIANATAAALAPGEQLRVEGRVYRVVNATMAAAAEGRSALLWHVRVDPALGAAADEGAAVLGCTYRESNPI